MNAIVKPANGFALAPANLEEAYNFAQRISGTQLVPENYRHKPDECLVAMMMGTEVGLNPIQSLQNIAVINGKPSMYGDSMLALVMHHPAFGSIKETFDDSTMTATCHVTRKGGSEHTATFSQSKAEQAGLWGKKGPWQQYPQRMLTMRARGFALRNLFADALAGLISREEAEDMPAEASEGPIDVTPKPEPEALPDYSEEDFEKNINTWAGAIESGRTTADNLIAAISGSYSLSEDQVEQIKNLEQ